MSRNQRNAERLAAALTAAYGGLEDEALLRPLASDVFPGRLVVVASFGAESALLLALAARVDPGLPVVFLDTGHVFAETLVYRDALVAHLRLTDVRSVRPDPGQLHRDDPQRSLWRDDPDACCRLRKVAPLEAALADFDAWVTGRKHYHGGRRADLPVIEAAEGRIKINPLARWTREDVVHAYERLGLPRHPLEAAGYLSIGCRPCTRAVAAGEDLRAGRWAGCAKTECGIHWPASEEQPAAG